MYVYKYAYRPTVYYRLLLSYYLFGLLLLLQIFTRPYLISLTFTGLIVSVLFLLPKTAQFKLPGAVMFIIICCIMFVIIIIIIT